jgi:hypothetical protein
MRISLSFLIVFLFSSRLFGLNDFTEIDSRSVSIPDSLKTVEQISAYLTKDLTHEADKVRAFYIWIAHNIRYDLSKKDTKYKLKVELIEEVLKERHGVCQHYSELFHAFCQKSGIKSFVIDGYSRRDNGEVSNIAHSWNAVEIDSNYFNIDVTWASGYLMKDEYVNQFRDLYFLIEPKEFLKTHLPFDPLWQFVDNPINILDFNNQDLSKLFLIGNYNYRALIEKIESQSWLVNLEQHNKRLLSSEGLNDLILKEVEENVLQISYEKCRIAVDTLNSAIDNYNLYIKHKNTRFREPFIDDGKLMYLIANIDRPLSKADLTFRNIFTLNYDLNKQVANLRKNLGEFKLKLEVEMRFVDKYIKTKKTFRFLLFV